MRDIFYSFMLWGSVMCYGQNSLTPYVPKDRTLAEIWARLNSEALSISDFKKQNHSLVALGKNKSVEKVRLLIEAIGYEHVVGRENSRMCDDAIAMLQLAVPLEYEFSWGRYKESREFRTEVKQKYLRWYETNVDLLKWNGHLEMFLTGKEEEIALRKHRDWRMGLKW